MGRKSRIQSAVESRGRRAYILIAVLGIATIAASVGVAYLEANSTSMPEALNRKYSIRALYLADSGIELGKHFLLYPPTTVTLGDYWRGGSSIAIDATNDYTNVAVTPHATQKQRYTIRATGIAKNESGGVQGKRAAAAEVIVPPIPVWSFTEALLLKSTATLPSGVQIRGNLHCNGTLIGSGYCNGKVSASGVATWLGTGPPTSVTSLAPGKSMPKAVGSYYATYKLNGQTYSAYAFDKTSMNTTEANGFNAMDMTATNPGRIICVKSGNFRLKNSASLNGTLIVAGGDLEIESGAQITAVVGFPAAVVSGGMIVQDNDSTIVINGSLICGGALDDKKKQNAQLTVNGTAIFNGGIVLDDSASRVRAIWNADQSWIYDFETPPTRQPITVVNYKED